ncbi:hypothetical protein MRX96_050427 [Rhipicephalus microplus]
MNAENNLKTGELRLVHTCAVAEREARWDWGGEGEAEIVNHSHLQFLERFRARDTRNQRCRPGVDAAGGLVSLGAAEI